MIGYATFFSKLACDFSCYYSQLHKKEGFVANGTFFPSYKNKPTPAGERFASKLSALARTARVKSVLHARVKSLWIGCE